MIDILCFCGSKKPPQRLPERKSACRELLRIVEASIKKQNMTTKFLDLRDLQLPWFEGLMIEAYGERDSVNVLSSIEQAQLVLFSLPAYWGSLSGAAKNLFDLLGGAAYDQSIAQVSLSNKIIGSIIVGAVEYDAEQAEIQLKAILKKMNAIHVGESLLINNPKNGNPEKQIRAAWNYGEYLVQYLLEKGLLLESTQHRI